MTRTAQQAVDTLNQLFEIDATAIRSLFSAKSECNSNLADHPTVQVDGAAGNFSVRVIGVLNGIFGCWDNSQLGRIAMKTDGGLLVGFELTDDPNKTAVEPTPELADAKTTDEGLKSEFGGEAPQHD